MEFVRRVREKKMGCIVRAAPARKRAADIFIRRLKGSCRFKSISHPACVEVCECGGKKKKNKGTRVREYECRDIPIYTSPSETLDIYIYMYPLSPPDSPKPQHLPPAEKENSTAIPIRIRRTAHVRIYIYIYNT